MGLDMYLTAKRYIYDFDDSGKALRDQLEDLKVNEMRVKELTYEAGYWRKANAVHGWFVQHVQDGEDNCRPYEVERKQLEQLRDLCAYILKDEDTAGLPPTAGFFFGSAEIDEGYWDDLRLTVDICNNALGLANSKRHYWTFNYQSSW